MKRTGESKAPGADGGVLGSSNITRKFQVTIAKKARERFGLEEGDLVVFVEDLGRLYLVKGKDLGLFGARPKEGTEKAVPYYR